jgi:hypothetical protein
MRPTRSVRCRGSAYLAGLRRDFVERLRLRLALTAQAGRPLALFLLLSLLDLDNFSAAVALLDSLRRRM